MCLSLVTVADIWIFGHILYARGPTIFYASSLSRANSAFVSNRRPLAVAGWMIVVDAFSPRNALNLNIVSIANRTVIATQSIAASIAAPRPSAFQLADN